MPVMITLAKYLAQASSTAIKRYRETGILPSYVSKPKTKPKMPRNMPSGAKKKPKMKKTGKLKGVSQKLKEGIVLNQTKSKNTPRKY